MTQTHPLPRRTFLIDAARGAAAGWLTLELSLLAACARDKTNRDAPLAHLTAAEARTLRALATQLFPSDHDIPGADEAGAVYFVDRAFSMGFFADSVPVVRSGLANLDDYATATGARDGFASLTREQQIAVMHQIEASPFFATVRTLVVMGVFAEPSYGGNRGGAGWTLLGMEHRPSFTAPFGWYDAQAASAPARGAA